MKRKYLSVLIVPHHGRIKHKKISYSRIWLALLAFFLLLGVGAFSTVDYLTHRRDNYNFVQLKREKEQLKKELSNMQLVISDLKLGMNELMAKEKNIRLVFGFPEVDDAVREVGVGGPNPFPYSAGSDAELDQAVADGKRWEPSHPYADCHAYIYHQITGQRARKYISHADLIKALEQHCHKTKPKAFHNGPPKPCLGVRGVVTRTTSMPSRFSLGGFCFRQSRAMTVTS